MRHLAIASLVLVIAACGPAAVPSTTFRVTPGASAATSAAPSAPATAPASVAATTSLAPSGTRPAFLTYAFTNVRDGSKFTLSDFAGKSVLVIGMAVW